MDVRFWGVRGSVACPGERYHRYGGNTSCIEVRVGGRLIILDGGTGLRELGRALRGKGPYDADLFLTHTHMDHIGGIPFFGPLFDPQSTWRLHAGHLLPRRTLHGVLIDFMSDPVFPVPPSIFAARVSFEDFSAGEVMQLGPVTVRTAPLKHPQGATGYRIEHGGRAVCYVTDTEHSPALGPDPVIVDLVRGADAMIYDCSYTDETFSRFVGWGHSTWQEGARIADAAGVGQLVIFHHDPEHDDDKMDAIGEQAMALRPGTLVAREGMSLTFAPTTAPR
jgi:phosphoribosyl 1,2-cyclic phosphodiesterase